MLCFLHHWWSRRRSVAPAILLGRPLSESLDAQLINVRTSRPFNHNGLAEPATQLDGFLSSHGARNHYPDRREAAQGLVSLRARSAHEGCLLSAGLVVAVTGWSSPRGIAVENQIVGHLGLARTIGLHHVDFSVPIAKAHERNLAPGG